MTETMPQISTRLTINKNTITGLRSKAKRIYGKYKADWPIDILEDINTLIVKCREDEAKLRAMAEEPIPPRRAILSLVVDNEKAFSG